MRIDSAEPHHYFLTIRGRIPLGFAMPWGKQTNGRPRSSSELALSAPSAKLHESGHKENLMRTTKLSQRMAAGLAVIALSILAAPALKAQCVARARNGGTFAPELRSLQEPAALDQEGSSDQAGSPEALDQDKKDSNVTILGLWKNIYFAGGALNDVGFRQFNAGGTELLNDSPVPDGRNNFCVGVWKRVGARTYDLLHTFLVFDSSGKKPIAIAIEQSRIIVGRDGNTFRGTWTQDNYDFSGNVMPGFHFDGTVTGERIAPGLRFPFPFPF
jgi:hypothetical protein